MFLIRDKLASSLAIVIIVFCSFADLFLTLVSATFCLAYVRALLSALLNTTEYTVSRCGPVAPNEVAKSLAGKVIDSAAVEFFAYITHSVCGILFTRISFATLKVSVYASTTFQ